MTADGIARWVGPGVSWISTMRSRSPRTAAVVGIALLACALVISRRVDAFTNAQFYAEDGSKWFANAYTDGPLGALDLSYNGYFQLVSRLGPVVAAPFGIRNAPLVYNIVGLLVQVAPVAYLLSSRFDPVVPSFRARLVVGAVYVLMPSTELNVDITTAQFHLLVLAFLVVVAAEPKRWYWSAFDVAVVLLCGLSGPFAYILLPVAALWFVIRRQPFTLVLCFALAVTIPIQVYADLTSPRLHVPLGASLDNLLLIVSDRIILAGLFAEEGGTHVFLAGTSHGTLLSAVICLLALPIVVYAAWRAPLALRMFDLTALGVATSGLAAPLVSNTGNAWAIMTVTRAGERYFLLAQVAWVITVLWAATRLPRPWVQRTALAACAVTFGSGLITAWRYQPFQDYHWAQEAREITTATPGTKLVLPIPPGGGWAVDITAK
jgi:hypothetical protein